jgi:Tfp pilus assembly protein PilF
LERPLDLDSAGAFSDKHNSLAGERFFQWSGVFTTISFDDYIMQWKRVPSCLLMLLAAFAFGCRSTRSRQCDELVSVNSDRSVGARLQYKRGVQQLEKGDLENAAKSFRKVLEKDSADGAAHNNLGLVYFRMRRLPEAATEFEAAAEYLPANGTPWNNLGLILESTAQPMEAIEYYSQAHQLEPRNPEFLGNMVRALIRRGDRGPEVYELLKRLSYIETRPEWVSWIQRQMNLEQNPILDRGPPSPQLARQGRSDKPQPAANGQSAETNLGAFSSQNEAPWQEVLSTPAPIVLGPHAQ